MDGARQQLKLLEQQRLRAVRGQRKLSYSQQAEKIEAGRREKCPTSFTTERDVHYPPAFASALPAFASALPSAATALVSPNALGAADITAITAIRAVTTSSTTTRRVRFIVSPPFCAFPPNRLLRFWELTPKLCLGNLSFRTYTYSYRGLHHCLFWLFSGTQRAKGIKRGPGFLRNPGPSGVASFSLE